MGRPRSHPFEGLGYSHGTTRARSVCETAPTVLTLTTWGLGQLLIHTPRCATVNAPTPLQMWYGTNLSINVIHIYPSYDKL